MRSKLALMIAAILLSHPVTAQMVTLTGTLTSSNGMPASNYLITFTPSQFGFIANSSVIINTTTSCATSTDGTVAGLPNPLTAPIVTVGFTGTLTPANYFVKYAFYDASGNLTIVSPERVIQLNSTGQLIVASPSSGMPAGSVGMKVYISASTNAETLQGSTTGSAAFIQSSPLSSGAAPSASNTTVCKQVANDAIWPSGTGYTVAMVDPDGNTIPGYPMQWQLIGPNTTINLSSGLPYYHGTVFFPTPIMASPLNHNLQSISGPLSLSGYKLTGVAAIGVGTNLPAWPIDVENGPMNASGGYLANGSGGTTGQVLCSNGTTFVTPCTVYSPSNPPPVSAVNYQTVQRIGSSLAQRAILNFSAKFLVSDTSPSTTVDLSYSGNTNTVCSVAGSLTAGHLVGIDSNGNCVDSGSPRTGIDYYWTAAGCTTPVSQPSRCTATTTLPGAMPDASYQVFCSTNDLGNGTLNGSTVCSLYNGGVLPTASGATLTYQILQVVQNSPGGAAPAVYFYAHHN